MGHHKVDVVGGETRAFKCSADRVDHAADRDLEDRLTLEVKP